MKPNLLPQTHSVILPKKEGLHLPSLGSDKHPPQMLLVPSSWFQVALTSSQNFRNSFLNCLPESGLFQGPRSLLVAKPAVNDLTDKSMGLSSAFTPFDFSLPSEPAEATLCFFWNAFSSLGFPEMAFLILLFPHWLRFLYPILSFSTNIFRNNNIHFSPPKKKKYPTLSLMV